ncbi:homeodomain-only protein [Galendromus occidentalis]|uniref:Homeodomain-only protein n=1 Tax=Galendromus occidentalis TaxID=34638 RepID=A0AAJ6QSB7_9ACAR|nr:homeodomain-only protein [Galendromus occidentalis]
MTLRTAETTAVYAYLRPEIKERLPFVRPQHEVGLEEYFRRDKNPQIADLVVLAAELGLPVQAVRIWFDHRLAKWRRGEGLNANWRLLTE